MRLPGCGRWFVAVLAVLAAAWLALGPAGCERGTTAGSPGPGADPGGGTRLSIVATTGMIGDLAQRIAGDRAAVHVLMGPGVDPHLYKTTRSDLARLDAADIIFYNGLHLEGKMTDALERLARAGNRVHAVTDGLPEGDLLVDGGAPGLGAGAPGSTDAAAASADPHVWMDPRLWLHAAGVIEQRLAAAGPEGAAGYAERAAAVKGEVAALDAYAERVLASVPERARVLVTAHDAFNYFGRRYGYRVEGIQGISTESEAGVRDVQRLVDLLVENRIPAVFVETSVSDRNVQALIAGARSRGHEVVVGGSLFSDALGAAGTYEGTYVGMIDHNVTTIARALGGQAPEAGMQGKLAGGR